LKPIQIRCSMCKTRVSRHGGMTVVLGRRFAS
jgi:hypothetical protein